MKRGLLSSVGPAIIVASVVLGPGSILASSRIGCDFGHDLVWLVVVLAVLLTGMTALAARLGTMCDATPCEEIARRAGRPWAAFVGIVLFLIVACFQFSNNVAVVAAIEPFVEDDRSWPVLLLVALNLALLGVLFGLRRLYRPVEILMKALVGAMILGFLGNLLLTGVSPGDVLAGLVPSLPPELAGGLVPTKLNGQIVDPLLPVQALVGTTFSVAGAFYTAYLVRAKGWTRTDLGRGLVDAIVGISVLGLLTLLVMVTAAGVLHGKVAGSELASAADVAVQLEPLFGAKAKVLFSVGLLAGALSSFLVNAMIGGTMLADGLGLGGGMDQRGPKLCTAAALLVGMGVAIAALGGQSPVNLVLFAQALTVLGNPVLAGVMLWLSTRVGTPRWIQVLAGLGFLLVLVLAWRTGVRIWLVCS